MRVAYFRRTEIHCSVPVLLLLPAAVIFNRADELLIVFLSLSFHELAHSVMAERLGYSVVSLEIQPFGFIARLSRSPAAPPEAAAVAISGPAVSLLLAFISAGFMFLTGKFSAALRLFASFNLGLGLINLIPALPLDGGRLLVSLCRGAFRAGKPIRIFAALGIAFGAGCAALGVWLLLHGGTNLSLIAAGFFIMLSAIKEFRGAAAGSIEAKFKQLSRLRHGRSALRVHTAAMSAENTVRDALISISHSGYNLILLTDASGRASGILDEGTLTDAVYSGNEGMSLAELFNESTGAERKARPPLPAPARRGNGRLPE